MKIIITSPSLDTNKKIAGISSVTKFIIDNNASEKYLMFELGRDDSERRNFFWLLRIVKTYFRWCLWMITKKRILIHFNIALAKPSILRDSPLILLAKLFRKRMVIHLHGGDYLTHKEMPIWMRSLLKLSFSGRNPKIVLSPLEELAIKERLNVPNLFVLHNCVDLTDAISFNRKYDKHEIIRLLFLGRISDKKGLEFIYQALESLKQKGVKFKFTMAGKGPDEEVYVRKFSELLRGDFEFKGVVSGDAKTKVLKENNVFLLPSFFEGLPMALLESMSFGLVPIATNVGSIKHVITDNENGIIINAYSAKDIDVAIQKLSENSEYKNQLSTNAKKHILNNFKPEEYIIRLNEIYNYE